MRRALLLLFLSLVATAFAQEPAVVSNIRAQGSGAQAKLGDTMAIAYKLTLDDGTVVDETKGKPFQFVLGSDDAIKGLTQGLLGARRGEIRELTIPPQLGYGAQANGDIPANSTLHFEVEVVYLSSSAEHGGEGDHHQEHGGANDSDHDHGGDNDSDHDHDHDGIPDHPAGKHAEGSSREGFENRPDAQHLDKPAIFEFMIRDFFTRPWRYNDAPLLVWKSNAVLTLLAGLAWMVTLLLARKGGVGR